jgi:hypothetical protein
MRAACATGSIFSVRPSTMAIGNIEARMTALQAPHKRTPIFFSARWSLGYRCLNRARGH